MLPMRDDDARWQDLAVCYGMDPSIFYAAEMSGSDTDYDAARGVCAACPVQSACLEHALARPEKFGMWGGVSAEGRRKIRRNRLRNARAGVVSLFDQQPT